MSGYQGQPDGPRDPATPGGYCLTRCYCGKCPQYAEQQRQLTLLREQEYEARIRREGERAARGRQQRRIGIAALFEELRQGQRRPQRRRHVQGEQHLPRAVRPSAPARAPGVDRPFRAPRKARLMTVEPNPTPPSRQVEQPRLRTVPTTLRDANAFVAAHHRHHKPVRGHTSSTAVVDDQGDVRGVAIIGRPLARKIDHRQVAEILRVATDGCANACSALYGACCRIGKAFGYLHVQTYTLVTESGTSLRAAGYKPVALTDGGSWSRLDRKRDDDHPLDRKVRWECRCSDAPSITLPEDVAA